MNSLKRSSSAFFAVALLLIIQTYVFGQKLPYLDPNQPIDKRVEDLLSTDDTGRKTWTAEYALLPEIWQRIFLAELMLAGNLQRGN